MLALVFSEGLRLAFHPGPGLGLPPHCKSVPHKVQLGRPYRRIHRTEHSHRQATRIQPVDADGKIE